MTIKAILRSSCFGLLLCCMADEPKMWSIYWMTEPKPCSGWGQPVTSIYYAACVLGGTPVSICPNMGAGGWDGPYSQRRPIKIRGAQVSQILTDPTASGYFVVGSASISTPGADVFASHAGVGSHSYVKNMPEGLPLYQGNPTPGDTSHIDVYASCDKGQYQMIVVLEYQEDTGAP